MVNRAAALYEARLKSCAEAQGHARTNRHIMQVCNELCDTQRSSCEVGNFPTSLLQIGGSDDCDMYLEGESSDRDMRSMSITTDMRTMTGATMLLTMIDHRIIIPIIG